MAYGKTKTAIAVAALAALPLGVQWQENRKLERELTELRGAMGWLIGDEGRGIANILEMVSLPALIA